MMENTADRTTNLPLEMFSVRFMKCDKVEVYRRVVQVTSLPLYGNVTTLKQSIKIKISVSTL